MKTSKDHKNFAHTSLHANQNAQKLLSTDLVNTNKKYLGKGCVPGFYMYVPIVSHSDRWFGGFVNR